MALTKAVFVCFKSHIISDNKTVECSLDTLRKEINLIEQSGHEKAVVVFGRGFKLDIEFPISQEALQNSVEVILDNSVLEA